MKRRYRVNKLPLKKYYKEIKYECDYQINWSKYIPELKNYELESVNFLSISGDAPKDFVKDREYRPGRRSKSNSKEKFIAKVGSKFYPMESIIEQLITRIGQCFELKIADSKLRTIEGQVRFMSRYFLKRNEQLTHGAEIYEFSIGKRNYKELSENKQEAEFFSFQMTCEAISAIFPDNHEKIICAYVEMLTFDAIIGHNDRHPYNWGVIVPIRKGKLPHFSPVFDTARGLFWNIPETRVVKMLENNASFESYINKCQPPIGWDSKEKVDFFELIALIWKEVSFCRENIEKFLDNIKLEKTFEILNDEFSDLLSAERQELIRRCLHLRHSKLKTAVNNCKEGG